MSRTINLYHTFLIRTTVHNVVCEGADCPGHPEGEMALPIDKAYSFHHLYIMGWRRIYDKPTKYRGLYDPSIYCPDCAPKVGVAYRRDDDAVFPHSCYTEGEYMPTIYPEDLKSGGPRDLHKEVSE